MALVTCAECQNQVSTDAKRCPKCGAKIKRPGSVGKLFLVLLSFPVIFMLIVASQHAHEDDALTPEQRQAKEEAKAKSDDRDFAVITCQEEIKGHLRDPASAEFLDKFGFTPIETLKDGSYHAQLKTRANNGFGGKTVSIFDCKARHEKDGSWKILSMKELH